MTSNQIAYQQALTAAAEQREIARSNRAKEAETRRSNLAKEAETHRSNIASEAGSYGYYGPGSSAESRPTNGMDQFIGGIKSGMEWASAINPFSFKIGL